MHGIEMISAAADFGFVLVPESKAEIEGAYLVDMETHAERCWISTSMLKKMPIERFINVYLNPVWEQSNPL